MTDTARHSFIWNFRDKSLALGRHTRLMGILNVTPDSFYAGSRSPTLEAALSSAEKMLEAGAHLLDVGGESSRPGAESISQEEELKRVIPVIREIRKRWQTPLSVDSVRGEVARQALEEGADIINDISSLRFASEMGPIIASFQAGVVLMHMRGRPRNMQKIAPSPDILRELKEDLRTALKRAESAGIAHDRIVLDPGIGFGKTAEDNLKIVNRLSVLGDFKFPILLGTSRKSFLGRILGVPTSQRLWGTAASVAVSIMRGAHIVRVHDVAEMRMVAEVTDALVNEEI